MTSDPLTDAGLLRAFVHKLNALPRYLEHEVERRPSTNEYLSVEQVDELVEEALAAVDQIQPGEAQLHTRIAELEGVLRDVELVINPRDREGISLHEWGSRLRVATAQILATLTQPGAAGQE